MVRQSASTRSVPSCLQHPGPRSWLSICSKLAVQWVTEKVGNHSFHAAASAFTNDITRRLKLDMSLPRERCPDPPPDVAWAYTKGTTESLRQSRHVALLIIIDISLFRRGI